MYPDEVFLEKHFYAQNMGYSKSTNKQSTISNKIK